MVGVPQARARKRRLRRESWEKRSDRASSVRIGMTPDPEVLHGHGGQVGEHHGQDQFAGFQFPDLAFPHQAQPGHQQKIQDQRS